jgi:hypothetical protein
MAQHPPAQHQQQQQENSGKMPSSTGRHGTHEKTSYLDVKHAIGGKIEGEFCK